MQVYIGAGRRPFPDLALRFPAEVNLQGESIRSDPEAAKRRETGGTRFVRGLWVRMTPSVSRADGAAR